MMSQKLFRLHKSMSGCKYINQSAKNFQTNEPPKNESKNHILGPRMLKPSNFDKWILVWMKKFKNKDEVPDRLSQDFINQTKSMARIKTANYMIVFTLLGCLASVSYGKYMAKKGETVEKRVLEENRKLRESALNSTKN